MSRVFAAVLASMLAFAPPDAIPAPGEPAATEAAVVEATALEAAPTEPIRPPGTILLAPSEPGDYEIFDGDGRQIGSSMRLGDGRHPQLELPAGVYYVHGPDGIAPIVVRPGLQLAWDGQRVVPIEVWQAELERQRELEEEARVQVEAQALVLMPPLPRSSWRAWASPLGSALVPGLGQFMNGQGGKGTALLFGTLGSMVGAGALYNLGNYPGAGPVGGEPRSVGSEYARLIGFGVLSTSAVLLWIYGIADAHRVGANKTVTPALDHRVRISATRMMTVGFRPDVQRPGFFDDWSVAIMGQATRRLTVGASDLSVKPGGVDGPQVWQLGARVDYRVFDRKRVWLDLALGSIFQVAVGQRPASLDSSTGAPSTVSKFGAVPYGQLDVRVFVLDRLSIDLVPRLAVPLTTRYYSVQRALPRFAPELEFGAGISTYF